MNSTAPTRPTMAPRSEHREGSVARTIERQTTKLPTFLILGLDNKRVNVCGSDPVQVHPR